MKIAQQITTNETYEGYIQSEIFFMSRKIGTDDEFKPRFASAFRWWRKWGTDDFFFNGGNEKQIWKNTENVLD